MGPDSVGSGAAIFLNLVVYFIQLLLSWSLPRSHQQRKQLLMRSQRRARCASNPARLPIPISRTCQAGTISLKDFHPANANGDGRWPDGPALLNDLCRGLMQAGDDA